MALRKKKTPVELDSIDHISKAELAIVEAKKHADAAVEKAGAEQLENANSATYFAERAKFAGDRAKYAGELAKVLPVD